MTDNNLKLKNIVSGGELIEKIKKEEKNIEDFVEKKSEQKERADYEKSNNENEKKTEEKITEFKGDINPSSITEIGRVKQKRKKRDKKIENILEDGLGDAYSNMSAVKKEEFRVAGEETTREISSLLDKTKVHVKKIIILIKKWLSIIPGINKFFLEQEAKIKADKIMKIKDLEDRE